VRVSPLIAVVNHSTVLTDDEILNAIPAFQHACHYDFHPRWDAGCSLAFYPAGKTVPKGSWVYVIADDSDQAGALAYHDVDGNDVPTLFNFAKTEQDYGASWTVGFTHELWEALADPDIRGAEEQDNGSFFAREVCDPVEDDHYGYTAKGADGSPILISDFITWNWFSSQAPPPYDFTGACSRPGQILPGGYMSVYRNGGWSTVQAKKDGGLRTLSADEEGDRRSGRVDRLALHRNRRFHHHQLVAGRPDSEAGEAREEDGNSTTVRIEEHGRSIDDE
jgi:hypothetical protein